MSKSNRAERLARILEFDDMHLHVLSMDFGLEMEGIVRRPGTADVRYVFDHVNKSKGLVTYWPSTDKLHIQKENRFYSNGLSLLYKYAKQLKQQQWQNKKQKSKKQW